MGWWTPFGGWAVAWAVAFAGLAAPLVIAVLTWLASLLRRDVSLVDRVWSLCIFSAGVVYAVMAGQGTSRVAWMLGLAGAWALRLALYITRRNWGHPEDARYQAIRQRNQPNFGLKSLVIIFALQAVLAWLVSAPLLAGVTSPNPLGALDLAGIALAAFGIVFEAVGDAQMARFKADSGNRGKVMDQGLWGTTRHPNYFGECCVWWGLWLMALSAGGGWSIVSPLLMTVLLLKVSGVTLLESDMLKRRPAYADYIARTNAFFPGPRKSKAMTP